MSLRIGMVSGETFCWTGDRGGMTRPDHLYQGHLARELVKRGHAVTVLTPTFAANVRETEHGVEVLHPETGLVDYRPAALPSELELDYLWVDRMNRKGAYYLDALQKIRDHRGPALYFQTIFVPGYGPPFSEWPEILTDRRWLVVNRAPDPWEMFKRGTNKDDWRFSKHFELAQWEPFLQIGGTWEGLSMVRSKDREYMQGYVGRLPQHDGRLNLVESYLAQGRSEWRRCVYSTSGKATARSAGADHLGKADQRSLPRAIESFAVTVNVPHPAFMGTGAWPNRIAESVIGGALVFWHASGGDPGLLAPWSVRNPAEFRHRMRKLKAEGLESVWREVERQRWAVMDRFDPKQVLDNIENLIESHHRRAA